MKRNTWNTLSVGLVLSMAGSAMTFSPAGTAARDEVAAARKVVEKCSDAVVTVRMVVSSRMVMQGREMSKSEETSTATATVVDPSGLAVLSYTSTNPGEAFERMDFGMEESFSFGWDTEIKDVKMRLADGRELEAEVVLRDKDLDLAFVRPSKPVAEPLAFVPLAQDVRLTMLDPVIFLGRLGKVANYVTSVSLDRIGAIIDRPRTFYVPSASWTEGQLGSPAFDLKGRCLGILLLRKSPTPAEGGMGMMFSGMDQMGLLKVVLPASDILEAVQQVPRRDKE